jgi:hypothetical protein
VSWTPSTREDDDECLNSPTTEGGGGLTAANAQAHRASLVSHVLV